MEADGWAPERVEAQKQLLQGLATAMNPEGREIRVEAEHARNQGKFQLWRTMGTYQPFAMSATGYPSLEACEAALATAKAQPQTGAPALWAKIPEKYGVNRISYTCAPLDDQS